MLLRQADRAAARTRPCGKALFPKSSGGIIAPPQTGIMGEHGMNMLRDTPSDAMGRREGFRPILLGAAALVLLGAGCSAPRPRVVETGPGSDTIKLRAGRTTQVEMPRGQRVSDVAVGNPALLSASGRDGIVTLVPGVSLPEAGGETNVIVRTVDDRGRAFTHQYVLRVSPR